MKYLINAHSKARPDWVAVVTIDMSDVRAGRELFHHVHGADKRIRSITLLAQPITFFMKALLLPGLPQAVLEVFEDLDIVPVPPTVIIVPNAMGGVYIHEPEMVVEKSRVYWRGAQEAKMSVLISEPRFFETLALTESFNFEPKEAS